MTRYDIYDETGDRVGKQNEQAPARAVAAHLETEDVEVAGEKTVLVEGSLEPCIYTVRAPRVECVEVDIRPLSEREPRTPSSGESSLHEYDTPDRRVSPLDLEPGDRVALYLPPSQSGDRYEVRTVDIVSVLDRRGEHPRVTIHLEGKIRSIQEWPMFDRDGEKVVDSYVVRLNNVNVGEDEDATT